MAMPCLIRRTVFSICDAVPYSAMLSRDDAQVARAKALAAVATALDVQPNRCSADCAVAGAPAPIQTDATNLTPGPVLPNDVTELTD